MKVREVAKMTIEPKLTDAAPITDLVVEEPLEKMALEWRKLMASIKCSHESFTLDSVNYVDRNLFVLVRDPHLQREVHDIIIEAKTLLRTKPRVFSPPTGKIAEREHQE